MVRGSTYLERLENPRAEKRDHGTLPQFRHSLERAAAPSSRAIDLRDLSLSFVTTLHVCNGTLHVTCHLRNRL